MLLDIQENLCYRIFWFLWNIPVTLLGDGLTGQLKPMNSVGRD